MLKSDLSLTAKLIVATAMTYPHLPKVELIKLLGTSRNTFFHALKTAKERGVYTDTVSAYTDTDRISIGTPDLVGQLVVGEKETKTLKATTPPTKEEVAKYAASQSAADLAYEFYSTYSDRGWMANGEPIKSWMAMYRGWFLQKPRPLPCRKSLLAFNEP